MTALRFACVMATPVGRAVRLLLGVILILAGTAIQGALGVGIATVGIAPIVAGVFNVCFIAPLIRVPFSGAKLGTTGKMAT